MPTLRTTVSATSDFGRVGRQIDRLGQEAVAIAAREGAQVAAAVASERSKTGAMASMRVSSATATGDGWEASFTSPVVHAWFQEFGTLGNRRRPLKQAPRTSRTRAPGTGVAPLGFLRAGRNAGRAAMLAHIARGLPR